MNVLKSHLRISILALLKSGVGQREIERRLGVSRKTIRRYQRLANSPTPATGSEASAGQTPAPPATGPEAPEGQTPAPPAPGNESTTSACEPHRSWIESQVLLGRNAMAIYQDLVEQQGFTNQYNSVKRFVARLKRPPVTQFPKSGMDTDRFAAIGIARAGRRGGAMRYARGNARACQLLSTSTWA